MSRTPTPPPGINSPKKPRAEPVERLAWRLNEVAKSLGLSRRTIERMRSRGAFPPPDLRIGKAVLWMPETLHAWVESGGKGGR